MAQNGRRETMDPQRTMDSQNWDTQRARARVGGWPPEGRRWNFFAHCLLRHFGPFVNRPPAAEKNSQLTPLVMHFDVKRLKRRRRGVNCRPDATVSTFTDVFVNEILWRNVTISFIFKWKQLLFSFPIRFIGGTHVKRESVDDVFVTA